MFSIYQCPVCGGRECTTSGDCARGCVSPITTVVTVSDVCGDELARLTRERDEARRTRAAMTVELHKANKQNKALRRELTSLTRKWARIQRRLGPMATRILQLAQRRECEHCGKAFAFERANRRFCSDSCRAKFSYGKREMADAG